MNKQILKSYYEMQGKIILPMEKDNNNIELAATVAANFASIGFPMTTEQTKILAKANKEDIVRFYDETYEMLSSVLGAGKQPKPFYPDFPNGCMDRSRAEYFIDQIIYVASGLTLEPCVYMEEKNDFPFIGTPMRRILMTGSEEDLAQVFSLAVKSSIAYSKEQREFIKEYVKENPKCVEELLNNVSTSNRENSMCCAMMVEELTGNSGNTKKFIKQPVDLLRYAAFKSVQREQTNRDPYLAISLRDKVDDNMPRFTLTRKDRVFIMDTLAELSKGNGEYLSNKMHGHDIEWNRLFRKLHITDKAWSKPKYDAVKRAILIIQNGERIDRPARRIEEAVKAKDVETVVSECKKMPGEYMRRFDKLYRMAIEQNKEKLVLDTLKEVSVKAGIATVAGTIGNIESRTEEEETRYFKGKTGKVFTTTQKNRKPFTKKQAQSVLNMTMSGLAEKFKGKVNMGNVYISDTLKDVKIPVDIRKNSASIGSMTSGSKMPIPEDWDMLRFFISWTDIGNEDRERIDIDLSTSFCNEDMNMLSFCGWNDTTVDKMFGFIYSGDVQAGGPEDGIGRAEYIDMNLTLLREHGVRYILPQVNSYTRQPFSAQPHTCFGVMRRTKDDFGKLFEPATVMNRFVLDSESKMVIPYIIDIVDMEILWLNEEADSNVALRALRSTERQVRFVLSSTAMSLDKLIKANVMANGARVYSPEKADLLFVRDVTEMQSIKNLYHIDDNKFVLANNMEYITGYLMAESSAV